MFSWQLRGNRQRREREQEEIKNWLMTSKATASETTSQQAIHSKSLMIAKWVSSKVDYWLMFFSLLLLAGDSCTLILTSCVKTYIWICQTVLMLTKKPRYDCPGRTCLHATLGPSFVSVLIRVHIHVTNVWAVYWCGKWNWWAGFKFLYCLFHSLSH